MASLSTDKKGNRTIQFVAADKRRRSIRLGKTPLKFARTVKGHVEELAAAAITGNAVDPNTSAWLRARDALLLDKLADVGLIPRRNTTTVGGLIKAFLTANAQAKPATKVVWGHVERNLKKHFGEKHPLRTVGRAEAEGFRQFLMQEKKPNGKPLADTTIHKRLQFAGRFFGYAVDMEWIERNPFKGVKHKSGNPREKQRYITPEDTDKLIEAAPNWVWRTIIALTASVAPVRF